MDSYQRIGITPFKALISLRTAAGEYTKGERKKLAS